jgi:hypothetical protein
MLAAMLTLVAVLTPDPSLYCEGEQACAWLKSEQMPTVFVRSFNSPLTAHRVDLDPALIDFPHFANNSLMPWRRCGEQIRSQAGVDVDWNQLVSLCHEVKHAVYGESHNQ